MKGDSLRHLHATHNPGFVLMVSTNPLAIQVDLWSAGVILYTMLVGRPPYESTDVKSTYRRILANVYAFPETVPVSDSAKNLVGRLLQVRHQAFSTLK